eukprot:scaffold7115_cov125-Isochrysis_galbana.AAC.5
MTGSADARHAASAPSQSDTSTRSCCSSAVRDCSTGCTRHAGGCRLSICRGFRVSGRLEPSAAR